MDTHQPLLLEHIALSELQPDPEQPRKYFDPEQMKDLKNSIAAVGIQVPLFYRLDVEQKKIIVSGERRYKAAKDLSLATVPAYKVTGDYQIISLTENIQRSSLLPMEEARAIKAAIEDLGITQEKLSEKLGKGPSTISEMLKPNALPMSIQTEALQNHLWSRNKLLTLAKIKDSDRQKVEFEKMKQAIAKKIARKQKKENSVTPIEVELAKKIATKDCRRAVALKSHCVKIRERIARETKKVIPDELRREVEEEFKMLIEELERFLRHPSQLNPD
ncbi:MAG: Nucleoid occlusion protein [Desulfovibrio sp.]